MRMWLEGDVPLIDHSPQPRISFICIFMKRLSQNILLYLVYSQLSGDAAHPTLTALSRARTAIHVLFCVPVEEHGSC